MTQEHKRPSKGAEEQNDELAPRPKDEGLASDVDDLLDEIDDVLEEDAETFVKSYIQQGGE